MAEDADKTKEVATPKEVQVAPEAQRGGVISENLNQTRWHQTQQQHKLEQYESATDLYYDPNFKPKHKAAKFELVDESAHADAQKTGAFIDYKPRQLDKNTFALGIDHENEPRSFIEKMGDFVQAAGRRASDPQGQQQYIQTEIDKIIGIGRGLNIAKEQTKELAQVGWKSLNDGTVAKFLAQPNAINDPLFKVVGSTLQAMATDPDATSKALEQLGAGIVDASERYSRLPGGKQGEFLGEVLFYSFNPSGSIEGGELALKIADNIATKVDATALKGLEQSIAIAKDLRTWAPGLAEQAQDIAVDYAKKLGLTPQEAEYAGVPREWLKAEPKAPVNDNYMAMSAEREGRVYRGDHDVHSRFNTKGRPKSFINEAGDLEPANVEGMYKGEKVTVEEHVAARWCKGAKAHSPYTSFGEKDGVLKTFGQGNGLNLDLNGLRQACATGEVTGVRIFEHQEVVNAIENSRFHDFVKNKLLTFAKAHKEVVVEGIIPGKFIEVGLK